MSAIRTGLNGVAARIAIAAAQERSHHIKLTERTTQNFDNRAQTSYDGRANPERSIRLRVRSHERLSANVVLLGMITAVITEPGR